MYNFVREVEFCKFKNLLEDTQQGKQERMLQI